MDHYPWPFRGRFSIPIRWREARLVAATRLLLTGVQGQYHFTYILAPSRHKKFAAFVVGWMTLIGWWVITCSGVSLCAVSVAGLIRFWHPDFEAARWQIYLIYLASVFLTGESSFFGHHMQ